MNKRIWATVSRAGPRRIVVCSGYSGAATSHRLAGNCSNVRRFSALPRRSNPESSDSVGAEWRARRTDSYAVAHLDERSAGVVCPRRQTDARPSCHAEGPPSDSPLRWDTKDQPRASKSDLFARETRYRPCEIVREFTLTPSNSAIRSYGSIPLRSEASNARKGTKTLATRNSLRTGSPNPLPWTHRANTQSLSFRLFLSARAECRTTAVPPIEPDDDEPGEGAVCDERDTAGTSSCR